MNEVFAEYIIKSRITLKSVLLRILALGGVVISFFSFMFVGALAITLIALMIYVAWYVFAITNIEYEYSLVNADLSIDKIMGQRKRKRVADYDFKKAEIMAYADSDYLKQYERCAKVQDYSSQTNSKNKIGVIFIEGSNVTELLFEPNERIIDAIRRIRPGIVKLD